MAFTPVVVSGTYVQPDGSAATGSITFQLNKVMRQASTHQLATQVPVVATLSGGAFSVSLFATTDPGTDVQNALYNVVEDLSRGPRRSYSLAIPYAGGPIDLASIVVP